MPIQEARSLLAKLSLGAEDVRRASASLSPGERTRAVLAPFGSRAVPTVRRKPAKPVETVQSNRHYASNGRYSSQYEETA